MSEHPLRSNAREKQEWIEVTARAETDECILWPWGSTKSGHGQVRVWGTDRRRYVSHVVLEMSGQPRPPAPKDNALHSEVCISARCVNPRHLRWGTNEENVQDRLEWGKYAGRRRITRADVEDIRCWAAEGTSQHEIAQCYQMSQANVSRIVNHQTWR